MNILEEIQSCPIEWKELGEVVEVLDSLRRPITKSQRISGDIPYYGANGIQDYVEDWIFDGTYILMGEDGSVIKNDNSPVLHWVTGKIWVNNHAHILAEVPEYALLKYVYYVLSQTDVADIVRGTPPKLNQKNLKSIKIPIPPLEIQEKIVQILDKMTGYVTELTSRKKQYSFYRDKLLSFEDEVYQVEWKTLGEVAKCLAGATPRTSNSSYWENGTIPWMSSGEVNKGFVYDTEKKITQEGYDSCSTKVVPRDTVVIALAGQGKTRGTVAITKVELCTNQSLCSIVSNDDINSHYLYYYLKGQYQKFRDISSGEGTRGGLNLKMIRDFRIPVPSLAIQSRIVQVLGNFDTVCNDLNIGLPKEIELRQKQYEYFREKLLTFVAEGEYTESRVEEWDNSAILKLLQWVFGPIRVQFGAMAKIVRGASPRPISKFITESEQGVPWIKIGDVEKDSKYVSKTKERITQAGSEKSRLVYKGDFIMSNSMSFGRPYILNIDGCIHDGWLSMNGFDDVCLPDYLYHYLLTDTMQYMMMKNASNGTVQNLNADIVRQLIIVLPPLSIQSQIVSVLDKLDTLTNSLSEGLPKEIELRQKQYEYWREQLLNFTR